MDARALFYQDSHLCRFTALVTGCHPMPDGWAVSLDRTAFYPEGGGQPWDLGTLGEAQVLAVTEQNGSIVHLCDRELPVGGEVAGPGGLTSCSSTPASTCSPASSTAGTAFTT